MVTVTAVLFLIATVLFVLAEMVNVSGANVTDGQRRADATAAFFAAESGLESAEAALLGAVAGSPITNATCTNVVGSVTGLPGATVSYSAVSTPGSCTGTACTSCAVTSIGQVRASKRILTRSVVLGTRNGVSCNGPVTNNCRNLTPPPTWKLNLENTSAYDGVAVFNLAYTAKGNNAASCAASSNCRVQFDLGSPSAGNNSSGLMGNSVNIPAGAAYSIYQVMDRADRAVVEVGVIFKGLTAAPVLTGASGAGGASYWNGNSSGSGTIGSGGTTGVTNNGTATSTGSCAAPSANEQTCTNWCYGGDTLVFSYAAKVAGFSDSLSSVTFGTGTGGSQGVPLTQLAKFPTPLVTGAPFDVEAEIWSASNPNLVGNSPDAANASSFKGRGPAAFGAGWNSSNADTTKVNDGGGGGTAGNVLTVGSGFSGLYPAQVITPGVVGVGDTLSSSGGSAASNVLCSSGICPTILSQTSSAEPSGALGGRGVYTISGGAQSVSSTNNRVWTISSNVLNVSGCTICFFEINDALNAPVTGRRISAQLTPLGTVATRGRLEATAGVGRYTTVTTPTAGGPLVQAVGTAQAGTPGATLYLPLATTNLPSVTTPPMRLAIKTAGGIGTLANNTTVATAPVLANAVTRSFTVNAAPTTPLDDVILCAGTCAFFVANTPGTTTFTIAKSLGTAEWASAFTCLKGVNVVPEPVTSLNAATKRWTETIN